MGSFERVVARNAARRRRSLERLDAQRVAAALAVHQLGREPRRSIARTSASSKTMLDAYSASRLTVTATASFWGSGAEAVGAGSSSSRDCRGRRSQLALLTPQRRTVPHDNPAIRHLNGNGLPSRGIRYQLRSPRHRVPRGSHPAHGLVGRPRPSASRRGSHPRRVLTHPRLLGMSCTVTTVVVCGGGGTVSRAFGRVGSRMSWSSQRTAAFPRPTRRVDLPLAALGCALRPSMGGHGSRRL